LKLLKRGRNDYQFVTLAIFFPSQRKEKRRKKKLIEKQKSHQGIHQLW